MMTRSTISRATKSIASPQGHSRSVLFLCACLVLAAAVWGADAPKVGTVLWDITFNDDTVGAVPKEGAYVYGQTAHKPQRVLPASDGNSLKVEASAGGLKDKPVQLVCGNRKYSANFMSLEGGAITSGKLRIELDVVILEGDATGKHLLDLNFRKAGGNYAFGLLYRQTSVMGGTVGAQHVTDVDSAFIPGSWRVGKPNHIVVEVSPAKDLVSVWVDGELLGDRVKHTRGGIKQIAGICLSNAGGFVGIGDVGTFKAAVDNIRVTLSE